MKQLCIEVVTVVLGNNTNYLYTFLEIYTFQTSVPIGLD